jgi:hypothetical protein
VENSESGPLLSPRGQKSPRPSTDSSIPRSQSLDPDQGQTIINHVDTMESPSRHSAKSDMEPEQQHIPRRRAGSYCNRKQSMLTLDLDDSTAERTVPDDMDDDEGEFEVRKSPREGSHRSKRKTRSRTVEKHKSLSKVPEMNLNLSVSANAVGGNGLVLGAWCGFEENKIRHYASSSQTTSF